MLPPLFIRDDDNISDTLTDDYIVYIGKTKITIPAGFNTDYASIPRFLLPFFVKNEKGYKKPAVIHDWLYWSQIYSKDKADRLFSEAMEINNMPKFKRNLIYFGVRLFGSRFWKYNKRKKQLEGLESRIIKINKDVGVCKV